MSPAHRDFSLLRGELRVSAPSPTVLQALTAANLVDQLLLLPGDEWVAGGPGWAASSRGGPLTRVEARAMAAASSPAARAAAGLRIGVA